MGVVCELGGGDGGSERQAGSTAALEPSGQERDELEIVLHLLGDAGPLHLDGNNATVRKQRPVDLGERGSADRLRIEFREEARERRSKLLFDQALRLGGGKGCDGVVQRAQRLGVLERHVVRAHREHLPRLDEGGAETLEHHLRQGGTDARDAP